MAARTKKATKTKSKGPLYWDLDVISDKTYTFPVMAWICPVTAQIRVCIGCETMEANQFANYPRSECEYILADCGFEAGGEGEYEIPADSVNDLIEEVRGICNEAIKELS